MDRRDFLPSKMWPSALFIPSYHYNPDGLQTCLALVLWKEVLHIRGVRGEAKEGERQWNRSKSDGRGDGREDFSSESREWTGVNGELGGCNRVDI